MKLLGVVLLLLPLSTCLAEVVNDFTVSCPRFFLTLGNKVHPPTRFTSTDSRFKQICQTLKSVSEFATYYDTANRIPVYSVYGFYNDPENKKEKTKRKQGGFFIEPQLEDSDLGQNMASEDRVRKNIAHLDKPIDVGGNQALNKDYKNSSWNRGHLIPVSHAYTQSCATATFTLTNAAPQNPSFNSGEWSKTERDMAKVLYKDPKCMHVYVVTGVVPGDMKLKNRVRIPSHFWTAFCCLDNNNKPKRSGAAIGKNNKGAKVEWMTVEELEQELSQLYGKHFNFPNNFLLFGGKCHGDKQG